MKAIRYINLKIICLWMVACSVGLLVTSAHAQQRIPLPLENPRSSPFAPPERSDTHFVVDAAADLDTGCVFNDESPLRIDIPIDRYYGTATQRQQLVANGVLRPYALLRFPTQDIEERHQVIVNGRTGQAEDFAIASDQWLLNRIRVPLDGLNFPVDPGAGGVLQPATNTVEIAIDVDNDIPIACIELDWLALELPSAAPAVLVNGLGDAPLQNPVDEWRATWLPNLRAAGWQVDVLDLNAGSRLINAPQTNAEQIADFVADTQQRYGVEAVTLVAHGTGAIAARRAIANGVPVTNLVQIGAPNAGSAWGDMFATLPALDSTLATDIQAQSMLAAAGFQLSRTYHDNANLLDVPMLHRTNYLSLAGVYSGNSLFDTVLAQLLLGGTNDGIVSTASAQALSYAAAYTQTASGNDTQTQHLAQIRSTALYEQGFFQLREREQVPPTATALDTPLQAANTQRIISRLNTVAPSTTITEPMTLDGSRALLWLNSGSAGLSFTLESPSGMVITPQNVAQFANVDYRVLGDVPAHRWVGYALEQPESGTWQVRVSSSTAQPVLFYVGGVLENSPLELTASVTYTGSQLNYRALLTEGGNALSNATVQARVTAPSGAMTTLDLLETNAGQYETTWTPAERGWHTQLIQATDINREAGSLVYVPHGGTLTNTISDVAIDTDSDGRSDALDITVGVSGLVTGQRYTLRGALYDSDGQYLGAAATSVTSPVSSMTLTFDGDIFTQAQSTGAYELRDLRLGENEAVIASAATPYTTAAYHYRQFTPSDLIVAGDVTSNGIDTNVNGLFDELRVSLPVEILTPETYRWSGRLIDRNGTELGIATGTQALQAGQQNLTFTFDGKTIRENGVSGQYYLTDVLLDSPAESAYFTDSYATAAYDYTDFEIESLPANTNFVQNGSFSEGNTGWIAFGDVKTLFSAGGILNFYRMNPGWRGASVLQRIDQPLPAGLPVEVNVKLGNASDVPKGVEVMLRAPDWSQVITCSVTVPPNTWLNSVIVRDRTDVFWSGMVVTLRATDPDDAFAIRADDVSVVYRTGISIEGYSCTGYDAPTNQTLVRNGDFSQRVKYWLFWGNYDFSLTDGVLEFYRPQNTARPAILFTDSSYHLPMNRPLQLSLAVGNRSNVEKRVTIALREVNWRQFIQCTYTLPPNTPLTPLTMNLRTDREWARSVVVVRALDADGAPAVQVDDVELQVIPGLTVTGCHETTFSSAPSPAPTKPPYLNTLPIDTGATPVPQPAPTKPPTEHLPGND